MKRFHCFLLALLMLFSAAFQLFPVAHAETLSGSCGASTPEAMQWTLDTETGVLTISGSGSMANYQAGKSPWSAYHAKITNVIITGSVASIGSNAFAFASSTASGADPTGSNADNPTRSVRMEGATPSDPPQQPQDPTDPTPPPSTPANPTVTDGYPNLYSVTLPESVQQLGVNAFAGCSALSALTIKNRSCTIGTGLNNPSRLTIYGYAGSTAQSYATTYSYQFVPLEEGAHEHDWQEVGRVNPTCTINGAIFNFCGGCGSSQTVTIPPLGHDAVTDEAVAPSCVQTGLTEGSHCRRCSEVLTAQQEIPALGHSWDEGTVTRQPTVIVEGEMLFTCTRCSETRTEAIERLWFEDVPRDASYAPAVEWAVLNGITTGIDDTHFAPKQTCTRGQVVTFLWRYAGCPTPTTAVNPFTDVKPTSFCYKAVLWAVENAITKGTSATTFSPNDSCTRGHVVTFLWRASGCPTPAVTTHPFTDVKPTAFYYTAMLWAVGVGITNGTTETTFSPSNPCTRSQIVTFLYRFNNNSNP